MPRSIYLYFITVLLLLFTVKSSAQELPDRFLQAPGLAGRGAVNYIFTKRGDLPMMVSIWGTVRHPGFMASRTAHRVMDRSAWQPFGVGARIIPGAARGSGACSTQWI